MIEQLISQQPDLVVWVAVVVFAFIKGTSL